MFEITGEAATFLKDYMNEQKLDSPLRVFKHFGCSGVKLALALDQAQPEDKTFIHDEMTFLVAEDLMNECGEIRIEYKDRDESSCGCGGGAGLYLTSRNPLADDSQGGGSCGCGSGGCG